MITVAADVEYLKYIFHIKDIYNTANDEILTGTCASTYSYVLLVIHLIMFIFSNIRTQLDPSS